MEQVIIPGKNWGSLPLIKASQNFLIFGMIPLADFSTKYAKQETEADPKLLNSKNIHDDFLSDC